MNSLDTLVSCDEFASEYFSTVKNLIDDISRDKIHRIAEIILNAYKFDKQIFTCGNGASAAIASHAACDLTKGVGTGLVVKGRKLRLISLTDNTPLMTALANDIGYEHVFVGQLEYALNSGDVVIGISASGNSPNVLEAVKYAKSRGATTIGIVGFDGGQLMKLVNEYILVPIQDYTFVEDIHQMVFHMLAKYCIQRINREFYE